MRLMKHLVHALPAMQVLIKTALEAGTRFRIAQERADNRSAGLLAFVCLDFVLAYRKYGTIDFLSNPVSLPPFMMGGLGTAAFFTYQGERDRNNLVPVESTPLSDQSRKSPSWPSPYLP